MDKKGVGLLVIVFVLGVVSIGIGVLPTVSHHVAVQEHQPTTATIQSADIDITEDDDGDKTYTPIVAYEYTVDGETHHSTNVFPGQFDRTSGSRGWAEDAVGDYSSGDQVEIQYSPRNPERAYLRNDDGLPDPWWIGTLFIPIGLPVGSWSIWIGFKRRRQRALMEDTPTEEAQSLSVGPSEITGTVVMEDCERMSAPFTTHDCVVAQYEIQQFEEDDDDNDGTWHTIEEGIRHTPFYVDDGTGSVLVRPHDDATYDLEADDWMTVYVDSGEGGPGAVQQFVQQSSDIDFPAHRSGKENDRKYRQNLILVDESAYVLGTARPKDDVPAGADNADRLVIEKVDDDGTLTEPMFMLSDDDEQSLIDRRKFALWRVPFGVLFVLAGVSCALGIFGPQYGITLPILY
jgi:hypothetical protein